jgi:hypothetical protein
VFVGDAWQRRDAVRIQAKVPRLLKRLEWRAISGSLRNAEYDQRK